MDYELSFLSNSPDLQRHALDVLMECFDEWKVFCKKSRVFPFKEFSFVATCISNPAVIAHVGLMPFDVWDGVSKKIRCAGVASVATSASFRGQGIASSLCDMAAKWSSLSFDVLPLYTAFHRVYEVVGWKIYRDKALQLKNPFPLKSGLVKSGKQLSSEEKDRIQKLYDASVRFPGYVFRTNDNAFHAWKRIFSEPGMKWIVNEYGYAVIIDDVLAELVSLSDRPERIKPLVQGAKYCFLSPQTAYQDVLLELGWFEDENIPDCRGGESVMLRQIYPDKPLPELFFPLVDKF